MNTLNICNNCHCYGECKEKECELMEKDNNQQIQEIIKFTVTLSILCNVRLDINKTAVLWIRHYAKQWRCNH
ncbi:MAG: hypothetical protein KAS32_09670 [Candidatus Peribacteraceae bacterium]|nr:hypothetical protein [Candidatus Peribacteraceae bacterium]